MNNTSHAIGILMIDTVFNTDEYDKSLSVIELNEYASMYDSSIYYALLITYYMDRELIEITMYYVDDLSYRCQ